MDDLAEILAAALRVFHHRGVTGFCGVQARQYPREADGIAMNEVISLVQADYLAPAAEYIGQVVPGDRANVYFASSKKYRWKRSSLVNSG